MNCLIIDDELLYRDIMRKMVELEGSLVLLGECENSAEALKIIQKEHVDLIFLDIQMPEMDGLELARALQGKGFPLIIFTTANADHAVEAFSLRAVDFLLKPFKPSRFLKAIERATELMKINVVPTVENNAEFIFIRESNLVRNIKFNDIQYFEATGNFVKVSLKGTEYFINSSLKKIMEKLPKDRFLRVHRSFIVNIERVIGMEGRTLIINSSLIPVSDSYKDEINTRMQFL